MSAITSPEFISLCRAQLELLVQSIAGSSVALYIADLTSGNRQSHVHTKEHPPSDGATSQEQPNFVPVVSYPEPVESWVANFTRATAWANTDTLSLPGTGETISEVIPETTGNRSETRTSGWPERLHPDQQLVVPLVYADVVVGLLVSVRGLGEAPGLSDCRWGNEERTHIESVAHALAAGCVLERRNQWLQGQLAARQGLQSRQSEVFHNLLHQFRNPLTAVSTFGQLLVKRLEPEDNNRPMATGIVRESKRLRELVTHFDEAVAIGDAALNYEGEDDESSGLTPRSVTPLLPAGQALPPAAANQTNQPLDPLGQSLTLSAQYIPDILEPILAVASISAREQGICVHAGVATDTPPVWGDASALGEVVSNLIDNAVKYSPAGAQVWVQTGVSRIEASQPMTANSTAIETAPETTAGAHYQGIVIGDTGPGIPPEDLKRLFERNYRGVQARGEIPGTGLGLAIAQSLVQEMYGTIEVVSPAINTPWMPNVENIAGAKVGSGTVFIVWLLEVERP